MNVIRSMKAIRKVKIRKSKMKFPFISIQKILTGPRFPEKNHRIFYPHVIILYSHKNKNIITFLW
jgi:hypothetical protein